MKKVSLFFLCVLLPIFPAFAYDTGRSEAGVFDRMAQAEARGFLNVLGMPAELVRTPAEESAIHPRLWPVTAVPRTVTNIFTRAISAVYDIVLTPFVQPFSADLSPLTDAMGLSDYPWQISESRA
ncbi:MAG: hypothetical protein FGM27_00165 [Candidatus Omnitrophica bacterium]|nr:hypothetical protein [Candidatus Omnitrophota bacterium]